MKIALWQMFGVTAWLALCLALACSVELPLSVRTGVPLVLTGGLLTFGRSLFPRPPARAHIENEKLLEQFSDLFVLGVPAFLLMFAGFALLMWNILLAFVISGAVWILYSAYLFSQSSDV